MEILCLRIEELLPQVLSKNRSTKKKWEHAVRTRDAMESLKKMWEVRGLQFEELPCKLYKIGQDNFLGS